MRIFTKILIIILVMTGCKASLKSNFYDHRESLARDEKVAFLELHHKVPEGAQKIGKAEFKDSGFSTSCGFDTNLCRAKRLACRKGANIVKIIAKRKPDIWSTCYGLKIEFYFYEGDVDELPQYQTPSDKR